MPKNGSKAKKDNKLEKQYQGAVELLRSKDEAAHKNAVTTLEKLAHLNFANAFNALGDCYKKGLGSVTKNPKKAFECYENAKKLNNLEAAYRVACCYLTGEGVNIDKKQGLEILETLVQKKGISATLTLAMIYRKGLYDQPKNLFKSFQYYSLIEDKSNYAKCMISMAYLCGHGVKSNDSLGLEKLRQAKGSSSAMAAHLLGLCHMTGLGLPKKMKNSNKAISLFFEAFTLTDLSNKKPENEYDIEPNVIAKTLAKCYKDGIGIARDKVQAFKILEKYENDILLITEMFLECRLELATYYLEGIGVKKDIKKAIEIIRSVLHHDANNHQAKVLLASIELNTKVLTTDERKTTVEILEQASDAGCFEAHLECAKRYGFGLNVERNWERGFQFLQRALQSNLDYPYEHFEKVDELYALLGDFYLMGLGTKIDLLKAKHYYQEAADLRNLHAINGLGLCYLLLEANEDNRKRAFQLFELAANDSHLPAKNNMAWCILNGIGTIKDEKIAVQIFLTLDSQNDKRAKRNLAWCFLNGFGIPRDLQRAKVLFGINKTPTGFGLYQGDLSAPIFVIETDPLQKAWREYYFGLCLLNGYGLEQNYEHAFKRFVAASICLVEGKIKVAACYLNGFGVARDEKVGLTLLKEEENFPQAKVALAQVYLSGVGNIKPNSNEAFHLLNEAISQGSFVALRNLALCYETGFGDLTVNFKKAIELYEEAAHLGDVDSQLYLGQRYQQGHPGLSIDLEKAFKFLGMAAGNGNIVAQHELAECYEDGKGVEQNQAQAIRLYQILAKLNYAPAQNNLASIFDHLLLENNTDIKVINEAMLNDELQVTPKNVRKLYTLAANQGELCARYNLLRCYAEGIGGAKDLDKESELKGRIDLESISQSVNVSECHAGFAQNYLPLRQAYVKMPFLAQAPSVDLKVQFDSLKREKVDSKESVNHQESTVMKQNKDV